MFAIIITKELHNVTNMLIFNLSLADITISAIVDTFSVVGGYLKWKLSFIELFIKMCLDNSLKKRLMMVLSGTKTVLNQDAYKTSPDTFFDSSLLFV